MINKDRIVPVTAVDLITLYADMLAIAGTTLTVANPTTDNGIFAIAAEPASGSLIASQPVKSLDFEAAVSAATVYFVAGYDYKGFKVAGVDVTTTGDNVENDGRTLYLATLSSGAVSIAKVGV